MIDDFFFANASSRRRKKNEKKLFSDLIDQQKKIANRIENCIILCVKKKNRKDFFVSAERLFNILLIDFCLFVCFEPKAIDDDDTIEKGFLIFSISNQNPIQDIQRCEENINHFLSIEKKQNNNNKKTVLRKEI